MKSKIKNELVAMWFLAWPVLIGQLATVGMGFVDVAMTGHLSSLDLASASLGTNVWVIVLVTLIGLMMSTNALVAHEYGAEQFERIPHVVRQSMWMALISGLLAMGILNAACIVFDYLQLTPEVLKKSREFVHVISLGMPAFAMYRAMYGYTTSINQTKPVMVIAILGLLWNIGINYLLIYGNWGFPKLGSTGCALATASGMWLMLAAMLWWTRRHSAYRETYPFTHFEAPNWHEIFKQVKLGVPIAITYFAEVSAFGAVGLLIARYGVESVSANQITLNFSSVVFMVPMSIGIALTTRVGQALGEVDPHRARLVAWCGVGISGAFAFFSALGILLGRDSIAALYTSDPAVQILAAELLVIASIFQLSDAVQVSTSCAIRGYKVTRTPMLIHLLAFYGFAIPIGCVLGLGWISIAGISEHTAGAKGFWYGLAAGLTVAAIFLSYYLHYLSTQRIQRHKEMQPGARVVNKVVG